MTLTTQAAKIASINTKIQEMGKLVENQIQQSMNLLKEFNKEDADKIILNDNKIDEFQKEIDEESVKFIATEQPLAEDLRKKEIKKIECGEKHFEAIGNGVRFEKRDNYNEFKENI